METVNSVANDPSNKNQQLAERIVADNQAFYDTIAQMLELSLNKRGIPINRPATARQRIIEKYIDKIAVNLDLVD